VPSPALPFGDIAVAAVVAHLGEQRLGLGQSGAAGWWVALGQGEASQTISWSSAARLNQHQLRHRREAAAVVLGRA